MIEFVLPMSLLLVQAVPAEDVDTGVQEVTSEATYDEDVDLASLKRIYARDSSEASRMDVEHPLQQICVRKLLAGSRVKARTVCQDRTSWIAYVDALEDLAQEWADTSRAIPSAELGSGEPAGTGI